MNLTTGILVTLGVLAAGCTTSTGTQTPDTLPADPNKDQAAALEQLDENLARLQALDVFTVGELIVQMPEEATACYGVPCPGTEGQVETLVEAARGEAALRLQDLVAAAEPAADTVMADACAQAVIDENIAALLALQVVEVNGLIVEEPKNNPNCYNLPCQEDIDAAQAITCERAGKLASIVEATKGL
jgi:hypothetical protein